MNNKNNKSKKVLAMLAAATLCSGMLLYVPADTLRVEWSLSASADELPGMRKQHLLRYCSCM